MIPRVSIIMPVYNAENTVSRMVDSIISQTFKEWELICIDDGSTDGSSSILDRYVQSDSRIIVMHKSNAGVSAARQDGLDIAKGEYVIHADADDWVEPTMLEDLYGAAVSNGADMVICDFYSNDGFRDTYVCQQPKYFDAHSLLVDLFYSLHGNCWNKLVKASVIKEYDAHFFSGLNFAEDLLFNVQLFVHKGINNFYLNKAYYHYYCPPEHESLCGSYSRKNIEMGKVLVTRLEQFIPRELHFITVERYKVGLKHGAFEHPIYTIDEYNRIYPETRSEIPLLNLSKLNQLMFFLSYYKYLYVLMANLYKFKNIITGHRIR